MLTKLIIRNFKRFDDVEIELGNPVVFVGPNDSGKSTALQALALWDIGLKKWTEKRSGKVAPEKRPGVTINRKDLLAVPVPDANLLWRNLHVRNVHRTNGKQETNNIRMEIIVEGVTSGKSWACGFEFDYANDESFYCRPLRTNPEGSTRMLVPDEIENLHVAFLPPMSGLAAAETRLDPGAINVRLGEGRTAEVLRNLCFQIVLGPDGDAKWSDVTERIKTLFGIVLDTPEYVSERGEIRMSYRTRDGVRLDLSSSGRGMQQTLLLLAHLMVNPGSVLLLDEPDAHLEILRQRQVYQLFSQVAEEQNSQIIAASHSEVVLNEAAGRDVVIAFLGKPHRIDDRKSQLLKSLSEIGFENYYQAEQTGWVLYLEGSTDLAILHAFAQRLKHPGAELLARPFTHYVANQPAKARQHFYGIREAKKDLIAFALFDRLDPMDPPGPGFTEHYWRKREIENYLCQPRTILAFVEANTRQQMLGPLFEGQEVANRLEVMRKCIDDLVPPAALRNLSDRWWDDIKATDDFLDRLFGDFFAQLKLPNLMGKTNYHVLASYVTKEDLDAEISLVLDEIVKTQKAAKPFGSGG